MAALQRAAKRTRIGDTDTFADTDVYYLLEHGTFGAHPVHESLFASVTPEGPDAIFVSDDVDEFFEIVKHLRNTATV